MYVYIYIYVWSPGIPGWYVEIAEDFYVFLLSNFWPAGPIKIVGRSGMDYPISYRLVCGEWRQWICTRNTGCRKCVHVRIEGLFEDQSRKDYRLQHPGISVNSKTSWMFGLIEVVQKPIVLQILVVPDLSKWRECCSSCSLHCLIRFDRPKHYRTSAEEVGLGRLRTRGSSLNANQLIVPRQLFGTICHSPEFFQFQMLLVITGRSMKILQNDLSTHFHLHSSTQLSAFTSGRVLGAWNLLQAYGPS